MEEKRRILVADGSEEIRMYLGDMLRSAGYDVVSVATGENALQHLDWNGFYAAILGRKMECSGIRIAREIRRKKAENDPAYASLKIALLTYGDYTRMYESATGRAMLGVLEMYHIREPISRDEVMRFLGDNLSDPVQPVGE